MTRPDPSSDQMPSLRRHDQRLVAGHDKWTGDHSADVDDFEIILDCNLIPRTRFENPVSHHDDYRVFDRVRAGYRIRIHTEALMDLPFPPPPENAPVARPPGE